MTPTQTYQIVLNQLSQVPASRMAEVRAFLDKIVQQKKNTKNFAGIWSDFSEDDFVNFQDELKKNRETINNEFNARGNR